MRSSLTSAGLGLLGACSILFFAANAAAGQGLAACGDIHVEAEAQCEVVAEGGCTAKCTPLACSAALYVQCDGQCSLEASAECKGSCDFQGCVTKCEGGEFDCSAECRGSCSASCQGDCSAKCEADANKSECTAQCEGSCKATCQGKCDARCNVELPDCETKCQASCEGSCEAKANLDCQMSCQSEGYASCTGGCKVRCEEPNGAIFCDGQFVDHGGNMQECYDALSAWISANITVDASSEFTSSCSGGSCEASGKAEATASCAAAPRPYGHAAAGLGLLLGLAGLIGMRRRA